MATQPAPMNMADAPADDGGQGGGFCIELHVAADGSMSIGVEPEAEEAEEEAGNQGGQDDDTQSVANLGDAMRVIKDIIANAGQIPAAGPSMEQQSAQGAFAAARGGR